MSLALPGGRRYGPPMWRGSWHREPSNWPRGLLITTILMVATASSIATAPAVPVTGPAAPAGWVLIIEGARGADTSFMHNEHARLSRHALLWPEGVVTAPSEVAWRDTGAADLVISLDEAGLEVAATAGRLPLDPGNFDIDTPLAIDDGRVVALLAAGRLVVDGGGLRYRRLPPADGGGRSGTLLLVAGLGLATAVLLRLARRRVRSS